MTKKNRCVLKSYLVDLVNQVLIFVFWIMPIGLSAINNYWDIKLILKIMIIGFVLMLIFSNSCGYVHYDLDGREYDLYPEHITGDYLRKGGHRSKETGWEIVYDSRPGVKFADIWDKEEKRDDG